MADVTTSHVAIHLEGVTLFEFCSGVRTTFEGLRFEITLCERHQGAILLDDIDDGPVSEVFVLSGPHKISLTKTTTIVKLVTEYYVLTSSEPQLQFHFPEDVVSVEELAALDALLGQYTQLCVQPDFPIPWPRSPKADHGHASPSLLAQAADWYITGMKTGCSCTVAVVDSVFGTAQALVQHSGDLVRQQVPPQACSAPMPAVVTGAAEMGRRVVLSASAASGWLLRRVMPAAMAPLAVGPGLGAPPDTGRCGYADAALDVLTATVVAGGTVWVHVKRASGELVKAVAYEAAATVRHSFGEEAGAAAREGAHAVTAAVAMVLRVPGLARPPRLRGRRPPPPSRAPQDVLTPAQKSEDAESPAEQPVEPLPEALPTAEAKDLPDLAENLSRKAPPPAWTPVPIAFTEAKMDPLAVSFSLSDALGAEPPAPCIYAEAFPVSGCKALANVSFASQPSCASEGRGEWELVAEPDECGWHSPTGGSPRLTPKAAPAVPPPSNRLGSLIGPA